MCGRSLLGMRTVAASLACRARIESHQNLQTGQVRTIEIKVDALDLMLRQGLSLFGGDIGKSLPTNSDSLVPMIGTLGRA